MSDNSRKRKISIAGKFNLMIILLILFLSVGIGIMVTRHQASEYYKRVLDHGKAIVLMVADSSEYALHTGNRNDLQRILRSLDTIKDIAYISILDEQKRVLERRKYQSSAEIPPLLLSEDTMPDDEVFAEDFLNTRDNKHYFNIVKQVKSAGSAESLDIFIEKPQRSKIIGFVQLVFSQEELRKEIRALQLALTAFTSFFMLLGSSLTLILTRRITSPLKELRHATQEISQGKLDHDLEVFRTDEIADLARAFNHMTRNLRSSRKEVDNQTLELVAANEKMQQEIRDRKHAEEALRESEERYALTAQGANDGLWDWNLKTGKIFFSSRWKTMLGYTETEIGNGPDEWINRVHRDDREQLELAIANHLSGASPHFEKEYRILHSDGTYRWMLSRGLVIRDHTGKPNRMAGSQTDITERKLAEEQLVHDAFHDALTGLPNRALFMDRLGHAFNRGKRYDASAFGVLFCDLDRFKIINDSLGHVQGDQLLIHAGRRLEQCIRQGDTVARLGGDEFALLLIDLKEHTDAIYVANRIHEAMKQPFTIAGQEVFITTSIGIAFGTAEYDQPEQLLRDADIAMYQAKGHGGSHSEIFDIKMHARALVQMQLETDLRRAVEHQEFQLHYQPIISLQSGRIKGFEALLRWQHPNRGVIPPLEFIPLAEETGLIIPIGKWVLLEACRQIRTWQEQFPYHPPLTVSVNISSKQLLPSLASDIQKILDDTNLQGSSLILEITESVIMENPDLISPLLLELKAMDIHIHIDDFGTGYSSLSYLHRFPVDVLKIDRSFIRMLGVREESTEIVKTIITLAQGLSMDVIAEGVEMSEQLSFLQQLRCTYVQGYLFSKPLDSQSAGRFLTHQKENETV